MWQILQIDKKTNTEVFERNGLEKKVPVQNIRKRKKGTLRIKLKKKVR